MLTIMNDLPNNVLGVSAEGKISRLDYETVSIPAIKKIMKMSKRNRLLYHLGSNFDGFDPNAKMIDAKFGMNYLSAWDKIALVSDHRMINDFARFFGYILSCEVCIFKEADLEEAKKWISEKKIKKVEEKKIDTDGGEFN